MTSELQFPRFRLANAAFILLAEFHLIACLASTDITARLIAGSLAAACLAGAILRWGWTLPIMLGVFWFMCLAQPFLPLYAHDPVEAVFHDFVLPVLFAVGAAVGCIALGCAYQLVKKWYD